MDLINREVSRTEGISTTDLVGRMLLLTKNHFRQGEKEYAIEKEGLFRLFPFILSNYTKHHRFTISFISLLNTIFTVLQVVHWTSNMSLHSFIFSSFNYLDYPFIDNIHTNEIEFARMVSIGTTFRFICPQCVCIRPLTNHSIGSVLNRLIYFHQ